MLVKVGQEYPKSIAFEGGQYNYYDGHHDLLLAYRGLEQWEIDDVRNAAADFALFANPPLLFLLYRFGSVGWGNCPYCWHLDPVTPPEALAGGKRILLSVTLTHLQKVACFKVKCHAKTAHTHARDFLRGRRRDTTYGLRDIR